MTNELMFFRPGNLMWSWRFSKDEKLMGLQLDLVNDRGEIFIEVAGWIYAVHYERGSLGPAASMKADAPKLSDGWAKSWV